MAKVELKKPVVAEISENIKDAQAVVLVRLSWNYCRSMTQQLRKELREAGVTYKVYKNTMMNFAFKGTDCEPLCKHLEGPNAIAISKDDATAPARILAKFAKKAPTLEDDSWCCRRQLTMMQKGIACTGKRFRQEKNFLENCLEASSLRSQILLAYSIRSQSPRQKAQQSKKLPGDIRVPT